MVGICNECDKELNVIYEDGKYWCEDCYMEKCLYDAMNDDND